MFMISQFHTSLSYLQAYTKAVRPVLFIITHTYSVIIHCRKKYHNIWVSWFYNISLFPNVRNCHILSSTIWLYHLFTHGSTSHIAGLQSLLFWKLHLCLMQSRCMNSYQWATWSFCCWKYIYLLECFLVYFKFSFFVRINMPKMILYMCMSMYILPYVLYTDIILMGSPIYIFLMMSFIFSSYSLTFLFHKMCSVFFLQDQ